MTKSQGDGDGFGDEEEEGGDPVVEGDRDGSRFFFRAGREAEAAGGRR